MSCLDVNRQRGCVCIILRTVVASHSRLNAVLPVNVANESTVADCLMFDRCTGHRSSGLESGGRNVAIGSVAKAYKPCSNDLCSSWFDKNTTRSRMFKSQLWSSFRVFVRLQIYLWNKLEK